jgi:hypothetical protein
MSYFAVIRESGSAWSDGGIADEPAMSDHATFMNALAAEGSVFVAGPIGSAEQGRLRELLIVSAPTETEMPCRLADNACTISEGLEITSISPTPARDVNCAGAVHRAGDRLSELGPWCQGRAVMRACGGGCVFA